MTWYTILNMHHRRIASCVFGQTGTLLSCRFIRSVLFATYEDSSDSWTLVLQSYDWYPRICCSRWSSEGNYCSLERKVSPQQKNLEINWPKYWKSASLANIITDSQVVLVPFVAPGVKLPRKFSFSFPPSIYQLSVWKFFHSRNTRT